MSRNSLVGEHPGLTLNLKDCGLYRVGGTIGSVWPIIALSTAGLLAGFAAGLFGIGGGFVVVPALIVTLPLLGGDASELAHVAIATSLATIIITFLRSVFAHARRGRSTLKRSKSGVRGLSWVSASGS